MMSKFESYLEMLQEEKIPTWTKEQIKQKIKDGKYEVNSGNIETVKSGSHIELRNTSNKKVVTVQIK